MGSGEFDAIPKPLQTLGGVLSNPLIWLLLLAVLIIASFFVFRRFFGQRNTINSPMGTSWQERDGPKDEYGRIDSNPGYGQPGYGGPPTMVQAMILTDMADLCTALIIHHKGA